MNKHPYNRIKNYSSLALILLFAIVINAQENMTIEKAIALGLENNFDIKIAEKYIQIAENNNTWAMAGRTPTVDLSGTFSSNMTTDNNPASFLRGSFFNGSLGANANVNYVVYNGGRIKINKEQLMLNVDQQRLKQDEDIHNLLKTIYQEYYTVIFQKEQLEVLESNFSISKDRLAYEQIKKEFGSSNTFNLIQFENAVLADSTSIISQLQQLAIAKNNLFTSLDINASSPYRFNERLHVNPEKIHLEKLSRILSEENFTLKSLEMMAQLNVLNTALQNAARKPTINLSAGIGFSENAFKFFADDPNTGEQYPLVFSNRLTGSVGANISYNLYDGGVRNINIQNAKIQEEIDQLSILDAKAQIKNQLDQLVKNYDDQLQILELSDSQLQLTQRNLDIANERFKSGQISSLDFRNIQNQLLSAAFSKIAAIYNVLITKSEIDFLVGSFE